MPDTDVPMPPPGPIPLAFAADLQEHLTCAGNDLERLQSLLTDASDVLSGQFHTAAAHLNHLLRQAAALPHLDTVALHGAMQALAGAIVALQFQDIAHQLLDHTRQRLRGCADGLARDVMGDDEDGEALPGTLPLRPNPVTQSELDAGSIELF